ncbi:MAG: hypothetical protein KAF27_07265 [Porphyrobacter sp.]|nr:hypothetical protein [Porphyrobacter sp.]
MTNLQAVEDGTTSPPVGLPYQLPRTQVTINVVWTLTNCPSLTVVTDSSGKVQSITNEDGEPPRKLADGSVMFTKSSAGIPASLDEALAKQVDALFAPTPAFTPETIGGEFYSIDYEELTNGTKTGSIKVEYHEGTLILKAVNAKVDGREGEALKSAFLLAGNVARIALGVPTANAALVAPDHKKAKTAKTEVLSACNRDTLAFLAEKKTLVTAIRGIEAEAAALSAKLAVLSAQSLAGKPNAPDLLEELQREAFDVQARLDKSKSALDRVNRYLSVEAKTLLPGRNGTAYIYSQPLVPEPQNIIALRQRIASDECKSDARCFNIADMTTQFTLTADLATRTGGKGCEGITTHACAPPTRVVPGQDRKQRRYGLVIRQPVEGVLKLTRNGDPKPVLERSLMVAQFGVPRTLPLRNGVAESNTLAATFDKNGMPTMIEYTKPRSGTVELLNALDGGAQTLLALQADRRAAEKAKAEAETLVAKNQLEALQRQRDMIKVQAEIDAAKKVTPSEIETLKAEIATLELLKQIAELKKAIEAAKPPPS